MHTLFLFDRSGVIILNGGIAPTPMHPYLSSLAFFHAMIAGLALAAPVGPVGLVCIRRSLSRGMMAGFLSGMGAAVADALYAGVAAFGVTVISGALHRYAGLLEIVGGTLLCIIGIHCIVNHKAPVRREVTPGSWAHTFFSTFAITLTNPATIIGFAALFSAMGLTDEEGSRRGGTILVAGVFAGSALWWLLLSSAMHFVRHLLDEKSIHKINLVSGTILLLLGLAVTGCWGTGLDGAIGGQRCR